jgi:hypothetical protein
MLFKFVMFCSNLFWKFCLQTFLAVHFFDRSQKIGHFWRLGTAAETELGLEFQVDHFLLVVATLPLIMAKGHRFHRHQATKVCTFLHFLLIFL